MTVSLLVPLGPGEKVVLTCNNVVRARLMDVTMGSGDELHADFALPHRESSTALSPNSRSRDTPASSPGHHKKDLSNSRKPSRRASVYDLEAELDRVKAQNNKALGALEEATKQIHDLEERLREANIGIEGV